MKCKICRRPVDYDSEDKHAPWCLPLTQSVIMPLPLYLIVALILVGMWIWGK